MKKRTITLFTALALLLFAGSVAANNINVSNIRVTGQNTTAGENNPANYTLVQFDLSWENSWRTSSAPNNWDAAWVFVKYRVGSGDWQHAWLNNTGHSSGTGTSATIDAGLLTPGTAFHATTNPALGVFIYRSADGTGNFSITGAQLRWNYGANGVADNATVDVKVFAIEMVYVPAGNFYVGSGGTETSAFYMYPTTTNPYQITGEGAITVGTTDGNLYYPSSTYGGDQSGPIPANFPKGYAAFYCQKYEISQQQYVDFLNTLTSAQASTRYPNATTNRHAITVSGGVYSTTNPYVACNFLSWMDGAAYSDWAGLRPMTELEFEKACRGLETPVANEYAWGTATVAGNAYTLENDNATNEGIASNYSTSTGNASYDITDGSIDGPLRVGIFAANADNQGRITAGASYYGIMELSGNLWERAVTVGNATGRDFTGLHGNGALSTNGHANETAWPGLTSGEVTGATGSGFRGGNWGFVASRMRVSDRHIAAFTFTFRGNSYGFRAVRVAP
ncbi:MAG TPA: SUMF1/EgtB/PvdO family nonheme iron enzyme [Smithellaceae bacterium]|nr:SUMF1/EgtB/PvdO family nonheme iron enzyme [Smithellaceae bacterium]